MSGVQNHPIPTVATLNTRGGSTSGHEEQEHIKVSSLTDSKDSQGVDVTDLIITWWIYFLIAKVKNKISHYHQTNPKSRPSKLQ